MKTKQEILDKENRPFLNMMQMETAFVTEQGALAAMESYVTQQLAEQRRKIEELIIQDNENRENEPDQSQVCDQSDQQVDWHLSRIKALDNYLSEYRSFQKEKGNLMARVFLRATGAVRKDKTYIIQEQDIFAWFENGDYLMIKKEIDTY